MTAYEVVTKAEKAGVMLWAEGDSLRYSSPAQPDADLLALLKDHKSDLLRVLAHRSIPPLPADLAQLVRSAAGNSLRPGTVTLKSGLVSDAGAFVRSWALAYLLGDREHALARLREMGEALDRFGVPA